MNRKENIKKLCSEIKDFSVLKIQELEELDRFSDAIAVHNEFREWILDESGTKIMIIRN